MYAKSLTVSNFRCFKKLSLSFRYPDSDEKLPEYALPNVNLLLGNNGMGKSAMLKALALAAVSPLIEGAGYVPYSLVRREKNKPPKAAEVSCNFILHAQDLNKNVRWRGSRTESLGLTINRIKDIEKLYSILPENCSLS